MRTWREVITAALTSPMAGGYVIECAGLSEISDPGRAMGRGRMEILTYNNKNSKTVFSGGKMMVTCSKLYF